MPKSSSAAKGAGPVVAVGFILAGLLMLFRPGVTALGLIFAGIVVLVFPHLPFNRIVAALGVVALAFGIQGLGLPLAHNLLDGGPDLAAMVGRLPDVEITPAETVAGTETTTPAPETTEAPAVVESTTNG